jgi:hypothetical protein
VDGALIMPWYPHELMAIAPAADSTPTELAMGRSPGRLTSPAPMPRIHRLRLLKQTETIKQTAT